MISYLVQVAIDGVMKYEYPFDNYVEALRCFYGLSQGTVSKPNDLRVVVYNDDTQEKFEVAHKEVKPL